MGFYINPEGMSKEDWLKKNGERKRLGDIMKFDFTNARTLPVCLVDNGSFTAAAIAVDAHERDRFAERFGQDTRPMQWWEVAKSALEPFAPKEVLYGRRDTNMPSDYESDPLARGPEPALDKG